MTAAFALPQRRDGPMRGHRCGSSPDEPDPEDFCECTNPLAHRKLGSETDRPNVHARVLARRNSRAEIVKMLKKTRERVGNEVEISVECRVGTLHNALRYMKAVEPFDLTWVEDPIGPTDVDAWAILTASSHTPTLTGEGLHFRHEFLPFFQKSAMRIVAPDFQICGGIAEGKKIAEIADLHQMLTCPHNASSPIGIAAALHACAAIPNFLALEFHAMPEWDRILAGFRPKIQDGHMEIPEGPGLGVELDMTEVSKYLMKGETLFG